MGDTYLPLLKATTALFVADGTIGGLVGDRIYSKVPQNATFPYIRISITSSPFDSKDTTGQDHLMSIQAFSREESPLTAANIRKRVYDLLHQQETALTLDNGNLAILQYEGVGFVEQEPDGETWQALANFRAVILD